MPFIELNKQLHPLQSGENLLGSGPEADLRIPQLKPGQQITIRVERVGALVWAVGAGEVLLNGHPVSSEPTALRDGDRLSAGAATFVYMDQAARSVFDPLPVSDDSTIPMGATVPMKIAPRRVINGGVTAPAHVATSIGATARGPARKEQPVRPPTLAAGPGGAREVPERPEAGPPPAASVPGAEEIVAVLKKGDDGPAYVVEKGGFRIGREKRCDLVIPEPSVSRLHAEIFYGRGQYLLRDLGRGGTLVNGKKIKEPYKLRVGDVIKIGGQEFTFARRPASTPGLVRAHDITPIFSNVDEAPTMISLRRSGGSGFTWFLILVGAALAAAIYLI